MSAITQTMLMNLAVLIAAVLALWTISVIRRDASIVDAFWGTGFVLAAWVSVLINQSDLMRPWLLTGLTTLWGLRLSVHLLRRNLRHGEDRRYAAMRERHGARFWWVSLFTVFVLQGGILWFVSLPIQIVAAKNSSSPLGWVDALGIALWAVGLYFEAVGDLQLARFKADPNNSGKVLDRGLWRYTRHPNYFGDFLIWWGYYVIATAGGAAWTIASPIVMSYLLLKVSGVTLLESSITDRRPGYSEYKADTNAFFPGPRKRRVKDGE